MEKEIPEETRKPRRVRLAGKRLYPTLIGVAIAVMLTGGILLWLHVQNVRASRLPANITENASFPVYVPHPLPDGFKADMPHASYDNLAGLVHIALTNKIGHTVTINEQALPPNFSLDDIAADSDPIPGVDHGITTSVASGGTVATIVSPDKRTLILLNTTTATKDELSHLAQVLRLASVQRLY